MLRSVVCGTLLLVTLACGMPGTPLGIYTVSGTVQSNTCGAGLGAPSPWKFNVELSQNAPYLYWNAMDGSPLLSGQVASNSVTMTDATSGNVDGVDGALGPCTLGRSDSLVLKLDGKSPPKAFTGALSYTFEAGPGSDCSDQLRSAGGMYATLPCTLSYALSGSQ